MITFEINFKKFPSLEAQIAAMSDDIAYNNHDIQDGIHAGLFKLKDLTEIDFSVALAYSGDIQIELIKQHCNTPSIYNEYVNNKKNIVHHFCTFTPNIKEDLKILEKNGYKNIQGGKTQDGGSFAYLSHNNDYGAILEIAQLSEGGYGMFDLIKEASKEISLNSSIISY